MKRVLVLILLVTTIIHGESFKEYKEVKKVFNRNGAIGTLIYYNLQTKEMGGYNEGRGRKKYQPASTI